MAICSEKSDLFLEEERWRRLRALTIHWLVLSLGHFDTITWKGMSLPNTLGWETQSFLRIAKNHYFDQKNGFKVHLSEQNTLFCMFFTKICKFRQKEWANCRYSGWFQINEIWKYGFCITRGTLCLNFRFYCRYQMSCIQAYSRFLKH